MKARRFLTSGTTILTLLSLLITLGLSGASGNPASAQNQPANLRDLRRPGEIAFLTGPQAGDAFDIAYAYLRQNTGLLGLTAADLADLKVTDRYVSAHTGVTHLYVVQRLNGIEVFNGVANANVMPDGRLLSVGNRLVGGLKGRLRGDSVPAMTPAQAVEHAAAHLGLPLTAPLATLSAFGGPSQEVLLSDGGISQNDIPAKLVFDGTGSDVRLAWNVIIYQLDGQHWWNVRVDADTGAVLSQNDWVDDHDLDEEFAAAAKRAFGTAPGATAARSPEGGDGSSYRGYNIPVESPNHTTPAPPADGRTLINTPAHTNASPFGWHDTNGAAGAEFTTTQGNNVHAYTDTDADNVPDTNSSPDGGASLDFDFPLDLTQAPSSYRPAAVTNLFLWNNFMHDVNYTYGFDEAGGNFQVNNYGRGGLGNDSVNAEAQDGAGMNNANFGTPVDGQNPRMQMFLWNQTAPFRDGDFDNGVIAHEYGHGISNRLTGGPNTGGCLGNAEQMGEGWSDWQGIFLTMKPGDTATQRRGVGTYVLGQATNGNGIRAFPYSTDMSVDPRTYDDTRSAAVPHGVGSIWTAMLWEMNWALIDEYGFNPSPYRPTGPWTNLSGNQLAQQLVTDGMKLQPCGPGFVDGRDAILQADLALTGGVNQCTIWTAFAKRGLGFSATQGSSNTNSDNTEAFDLPSLCRTLGATPDTVNICSGSNAVYNVGVGSEMVAPVTLSATGHPAGTTATFNPNPVATTPSLSTLTIGNTASVPTGSYVIQVTGTAVTSTHSVTVTLNATAAAPAAPALTAPANGATGVALAPTFGWNAAATAESYLLEVATDAAITTVVYSATVTGTSHTLPLSLVDNQSYFWRVTSNNICGTSPASGVFTFRTAALPGTCATPEATQVAYESDFESGATGWTHSGTGDSWALQGTQTHSGANAWHANDPSTLSDQRLVSPAIVLPAASQSPLTMRFQNRQSFETPNTDGRCWDAGILEVSTNGGSSWTKVPQASLLTDPYDNVIWNDQAGNNPIAVDYGATQAWCNPGNPASWVNSVVDLDAYAGQTVNFRWRLGSDSAAGNEGWYIDDVKVQSCTAAATHAVTLGPDAAQNGAPGATVTYNIPITNTGTANDIYNVAISGQTWTTNGPANVQLNAGQSAMMTITVNVPANAGNGDSDTATVTVTSQADGSVSASTDLTTTAQVGAIYAVQLGPDAALSGEAGDVVTYTVAITNSGNTSDIYNVSFSGNLWMTQGPINVQLNAGQSAMMTITVAIPPTATAGESDTVTVTVTSQGNGSVNATVDLTTSVPDDQSNKMYWPVLLR